jgi:hypothetical protein
LILETRSLLKNILIYFSSQTVKIKGQTLKSEIHFQNRFHLKIPILSKLSFQIRSLCSRGHPGEKYNRDIELGSGAGGTVYLAKEKSNPNSRVAIKIIDVKRQAKKELILMELKVGTTFLFRVYLGTNI